MLAPVVLDDKCVGCGLCQTRCYAINVKEKGMLARSAIIVEAGKGREDRLMTGSYIELREREKEDRKPKTGSTPSGFFVPGQEAVGGKSRDDHDENPFGL